MNRLATAGKLSAFCSALLVLSSGCYGVFHPEADQLVKAAQGSTGIETALTLMDMIEQTLSRVRTQPENPSSFNGLHHQLHALQQAMCQISEEEAATPAYAQAVTLKKELETVFHRLWQYRDDPPRRDLHFDLFEVRLTELRAALQRTLARSRQ